MATCMLLRRQTRLVPSYLGRSYATAPGSSQQAVQTPVQSQPADSISPTPATPASTSNKVQTPIQSQNTNDYIIHEVPNQQRGGKDDISAMPFYMLGAFVILAPYPIYLYWQYRKRHMDEKWARMLEEARQKQANS